MLSSDYVGMRMILTATSFLLWHRRREERTCARLLRFVRATRPSRSGTTIAPWSALSSPSRSGGSLLSPEPVHS